MITVKNHQFINAVLISLIFFTPFRSNSQTKKTQLTAVKAIQSNLAADAVGVNTHLNYSHTKYASNYEDIIKPRLIELGTKHIRDHFGNAGVNARYVELAHKYGIKLLFLNDDIGTNLPAVREEVKRLNEIDPSKPVIDMIEAANERDNGWKQDWQKLGFYMEIFHNVYKSDPVTANIPLVGPSFANTRDAAIEMSKVWVNAPNTFDVGNLHAYSGLYPESPYAGGWGISFDKAIEAYKSISKYKPLLESESGYKMSEGMDGHPSVSQRTAAKYSPRLVLERMRKGISKVFFYQLINDNEDFGLLNNDGSPREQFTSLKNFITLMHDEGPGFEPGELKYSLTGSTKDIYQMLFQKRNGNYLLLVWQGINGSNQGTKDNDQVNVENPDKKIILNLAKKAASVKVYRPSFNKMPDGNGIKPITTLNNKSIVSLSVPDHILIVEISLK